MPCATPSNSVLARRRLLASPGVRKQPHRSMRIPPSPSSSCSRRSRTATTSRTSMPILRWLRTCWRGSAPDSAPGRSVKMRVLGLDPGLRHTGWGIIDVDGNRLVHVADGVAHAATDQPLAMRLVSLFRQIGEVLERFRPDEAAVEESFVNRNAASTLKLGVARGVVLLAPAERGMRVTEYSANLIKKSVVGAGHAEKSQVELMVRRLLPGCTVVKADAADALAVAICHAHHAGTMNAWMAAR